MFKEQLKELRNQKGITQDELAKIIYVSRSAICKWELGKGFPSEVNINALCNYFEVSRDFLLDEKVEEINRVEKKDVCFKVILSMIGIIVPILLLVLCNIKIFKNSYNDFQSDTISFAVLMGKKSILNYFKISKYIFTAFYLLVIVFSALNLFKVIKINIKKYNMISWSLTITCVLLFVVIFTIAIKTGNDTGWHL